MKTSVEIVENVLAPRLRGRKALEIGFFSGNSSTMFAKYVDSLTAIDISDYAYDFASKNLAGKMPDNLELKVMDAADMQFPDKSFEVAIFESSFHEMEKMSKVLSECDRVLGYKDSQKVIMFIEPTEASITNELFKIFDPQENHAERISRAIQNIESFAASNGYNLVKLESSISRNKFSTEEELLSEMLAWWCDIKVPANEAEDKVMRNQIKEVLLRDAAQDFMNLEVNETIWSWILEKD